MKNYKLTSERIRLCEVRTRLFKLYWLYLCKIKTMGYCKLIFVLDNGTEIEGKEPINKHLRLFPDGILETVKPIYFEGMSKAINWNQSVVRVYQNGKIDPVFNIPPDVPFNMDLI